MVNLVGLDDHLSLSGIGDLPQPLRAQVLAEAHFHVPFKLKFGFLLGFEFGLGDLPELFKSGEVPVGRVLATVD